MTACAAELGRLHGVPVRIDSARVGIVEHVVADASGERVIGLAVRRPDGRVSFLPWVACDFEGGVIRASSTLVLLPATQLEYYVRRGMRLDADALDGATVAAEGLISRAVGPPEPAF